jgi:acetate---CoA ligase (ADP-forming) subunit beta
MGRTLSESESKALLTSFGVRCAPEVLVADPEAAVAAAREVGFPVVAKLSAPGLAHKTERGLVRLDLSAADDVREAVHDLFAAARPEDGDVSVLVAPMVRGARELIAGVHDDAQFGRCVMVGIGGVLAEAVADVAFRLAPLEPIDAQEMLDDLHGQALLGPVRGEAPVDRDAVAAVLLALSRLAAERPDVTSVDVNPLVVDATGTPIAVDALVEVAR